MAFPDLPEIYLNKESFSFTREEFKAFAYRYSELLKQRLAHDIDYWLSSGAVKSFHMACTWDDRIDVQVEFADKPGTLYSANTLDEGEGSPRSAVEFLYEEEWLSLVEMLEIEFENGIRLKDVPSLYEMLYGNEYPKFKAKQLEAGLSAAAAPAAPTGNWKPRM